MENIKETPSIRDLAQVASRLQFEAMVKLLEAVLELEKCPNKEFLVPAIERLNEAWSLSKNKMKKKILKNTQATGKKYLSKFQISMKKILNDSSGCLPTF